MKWSFKKKEKVGNKPLPVNQLDKLRQSGRFYGVQVCQSGCKSCSHLAGKVFFFDDAPRLPVNGCDAIACKCEYLGVPERRKSNERRSYRDRRVDIRMSVDRRSMNDRRLKSDNWKGYDL